MRIELKTFETENEDSRHVLHFTNADRDCCQQTGESDGESGIIAGPTTLGDTVAETFK